MSRVQYYVGNVEYKPFNDIPVNNGTVITIKSTFEDTMSGIKDTDEITIEVVFEKKVKMFRQINQITICHYRR